MPVWGFNSNFTNCFIAFWLTTPFWNILIQNMTKKQHQLLLILLLGIYTILGSIPSFKITFNYVTRFGIIYLIASYIHLYPNKVCDNRKLWEWISVTTIIIAFMSTIFMQYIFHTKALSFVSDSNRIVATSTFLWFKNLNISYSKIINAIGGSTFGVLLIHANSDAMHQWLWQDTVNCVGHYSRPFSLLILFCIGTVLTVFFICIQLIE